MRKLRWSSFALSLNPELVYLFFNFFRTIQMIEQKAGNIQDSGLNYNFNSIEFSIRNTHEKHCGFTNFILIV